MKPDEKLSDQEGLKKKIIFGQMLGSELGKELFSITL